MMKRSPIAGARRFSHEARHGADVPALRLRFCPRRTSLMNGQKPGLSHTRGATTAPSLVAPIFESALMRSRLYQAYADARPEPPQRSYRSGNTMPDARTRRELYWI